MEQRDVIRCPNCGTIVRRDSNKCGVCGADLFTTPATTLAQAVQDEEREQLLATAELNRKERGRLRKKAMKRIVEGVVGGALIVSGYTLLTSTPPGSLPDVIGYILAVTGLAVLYAFFGPSFPGRATRTRI